MNKNDFFLTEVSQGDFLGDYQVLETLGRGPTGTTTHVISNSMGKEFALKSMVLMNSLTLSWLDRLDAQTTLLGKLTHSNIDRVVTSGRSGNLWYCLKDFAHDGEGNSCDLKTFRERHGGVLSPHQVFHIAKQIIEALQYAESYEDPHHQGVHHGNLKPENILIAYSSDLEQAPLYAKLPFEVKVTDFQPYGLVDEELLLECHKQLTGSLENYGSRITEKAVADELLALFSSYDYQAPEKNRELLPNMKGDLYSLGVIIYEMLTGKVPVGFFPMPSEVRPELSDGWDHLLRNMLQQDPTKRYRKYSDLLFDLNSCSEEEAVEEVKTEIAVSVKKKSSKERRSITPPGMVYIPAGSFFVGSAECGEDALPQHEVATEGFYIDRTPVTNAQFAVFVRETGYVTTAEQGEGAPIWMDGQWKVLPGISWRSPLGVDLPEDFDHHPVVQVTFADAQAYAEWKGQRLPTEQEWEYAARGGQKDVRFPWGNTITRSNANFSSHGTCKVMDYLANGYGLYDMAGNVWEWTASFYEAYPGNERENPHFGDKYRVVRGGAWMYDGAHCMISYRNANQADHCYPTLGIRLVADFVPRDL